MQLHVGDQVVHPVLGVGIIKTFSKQLFFGDKARLYYQVTVQTATVWVPTNKQGTSVLRKIATKASLNECRSLLQRHPVPLHQDHRIRGLQLVHLLKDKSLPALCKTVRDLTAHSRQKPLGITENELLKKTFKALCDEWAASNGVIAKVAREEIEALLLT